AQGHALTRIRPSRGSASRMCLGGLVRSWMFWLMMAALFVAFFGPILWMGTTSLKTYGEATSIPPTLLPSSFDTSAYDTLLSLDGQYPVLRWVLNSLVADRKSTRLNSSHVSISYAVFCLKKKRQKPQNQMHRHHTDM